MSAGNTIYVSIVVLNLLFEEAYMNLFLIRKAPHYPERVSNKVKWFNTKSNLITIFMKRLLLPQEVLEDMAIFTVHHSNQVSDNSVLTTIQAAFHGGALVYNMVLMSIHTTTLYTNHQAVEEPVQEQRTSLITLPLDLPAWAKNNYTVNCDGKEKNEYYFHQVATKTLLLPKIGSAILSQTVSGYVDVHQQ